MPLTAAHRRRIVVHAHLRQSRLFASFGYDQHFLPGVFRFEYNFTDAGPIPTIFEATLDIKRVVLTELPGLGKYVVFVGGNPHQGCWMLTHAQIERLQATCNRPFFDANGDQWVEFWSGGMQIYIFCSIWKAIPLESFYTHAVHHAANNKLGIKLTERSSPTSLSNFTRFVLGKAQLRNYKGLIRPPRNV